MSLQATLWSIGGRFLWSLVLLIVCFNSVLSVFIAGWKWWINWTVICVCFIVCFNGWRVTFDLEYYLSLLMCVLMVEVWLLIFQLSCNYVAIRGLFQCYIYCKSRFTREPLNYEWKLKFFQPKHFKFLIFGGFQSGEFNSKGGD